MAEYTDISKWNILEWVTTTGTREKCFVENPINNKLFFFKESIGKYPDEFWSEIIASKIGSKLGFVMLDYNIAKHGEVFGCICESMIDQSLQELEHGINLIKNSISGFKVSYRPSISFQQASDALSRYNPQFVNKFIEVMVFDALIGNQDRHSENWAIIRSLDISNKQDNISRITKFFYNQYKKSGLNLRNVPFKKYFLSMMNESQLIDYKFSPIYDSGSSLGRELDQTKIDQLLKVPEILIHYIQKGKSEILYEQLKVNHFELLDKIKSNNAHVEKCINMVSNKWNELEVKEIVFDIDRNIPNMFSENKLPLHRKELIYNLLTKRYSLLVDLVK